MPRDKKKSTKFVKEGDRSGHSSQEFVYEGKFFAFSVLLAGLAALCYWYYYCDALPPQEPPLFAVVDIDGKGKGLVAERDITQGELVLKEKPLFVVPKTGQIAMECQEFELKPPTVTSTASTLIYSRLQGLSPQDQQLFLNLSYVHLPKNIDEGHLPQEIALAIFQTNAVAAGNDVGIFPTMARLNHGCAAAFNVVYNWREDEKCLVVHALKNVRKGQELMTVYMDTKRPRDERRAYLSQQYGFHCSCDVCSLPDKLSKASDERLSKISRLYQEFSNWGNHKIEGSQAVDYIRKIWKMEEEEGYFSERGQLAADAAWIAASHSDGMAVREWAEIARKWFSYEIGADSSQARAMERVVAHPELHKSWGTRGNLRVGGLDRR